MIVLLVCVALWHSQRVGVYVYNWMGSRVAVPATPHWHHATGITASPSRQPSFLTEIPVEKFDGLREGGCRVKK